MCISSWAVVMFSVKENTQGKMKGMLINEIPYVNHYFHDNNDSNMVTGVSYGRADAGSISEAFDSVGNASSSSSLSYMNPFYDTSDHGTVNPTVRYMDSVPVKNKPNGDYVFNDVPYQLALCENLQRLNIGGEQKNYCNSNTGQFRVDPDGDLVGLNHPLSNGVGGFNEDAFYGYHHPVGLRLGCDVNDSMGSFSFLSKRNSSAQYNDDYSYMRLLKVEQEKDHCSRDVQLQMPSGVNNDVIDTPWPNDGCFYKTTQQRGLINDGGLRNSQYFNPLAGFDMGCKLPTVKQKAGEISNDGIKLHPPLPPMASAEELGAFSYEDTFIVDGKLPTCAVDKKSNRSKASKKKLKERSQEKEPVPDFMSRHEQSSNRGAYQNGLLQDICSEMLMRPFYCSLTDLKGYIYLISKHQLGCRFLQRVFDEGNSEDTKLIFTEILPHIVELMMDPFGNYLTQKLLDFCNEDQKLQIVLMLTRRRGELVSICFNSHGTRVVQKLIQTMKNTQQISLLMIALKPGMVELIKDINGNHVVQRCLQCLSNEENKFIFDAATKFCVEIACHRHGCCVLNRCVAYSNGKYREKLVTSISANSLFLAQDAFGNYVIQHIIELKIPYAAATLLSLFEGHYAYLSMQKFSSHVVEKCLRCLEDSRTRIIQELISVPHFDQLLQDRFANYVIQSALEVSKGSIRSLLVEALRPYEILRTNPYCKKIFSRNLFKK